MEFVRHTFFDWQRRFCQNRSCAVGVWLVSEVPKQEALWVISENRDDRMQVVAANVPVCPTCGADLLTVIELEGGIGGDVGEEAGSLFDFVRSLP